jgi:hypothetical protein
VKIKENEAKEVTKISSDATIFGNASFAGILAKTCTRSGHLNALRHIWVKEHPKVINSPFYHEVFL